jgi:hypothetical protein
VVDVQKRAARRSGAAQQQRSHDPTTTTDSRAPHRSLRLTPAVSKTQRTRLGAVPDPPNLRGAPGVVTPGPRPRTVQPTTCRENRSPRGAQPSRVPDRVLDVGLVEPRGE